MSPSRAAAVVVILTIVVTAACARALKGNKGDSTFIEAETTILVENHNWLDMVVYAVRSGTRLRLGAVTTGSSAEFQLPSGFASGAAIRLVADPVGSRRSYSTEPILLSPGRQLQFRVENNLAMSSVSVW